MVPGIISCHTFSSTYPPVECYNKPVAMPVCFISHANCQIRNARLNPAQIICAILMIFIIPAKAHASSYICPDPFVQLGYPDSNIIIGTVLSKERTSHEPHNKQISPREQPPVVTDMINIKVDEVIKGMAGLANDEIVVYSDLSWSKAGPLLDAGQQYLMRLEHNPGGDFLVDTCGAKSVAYESTQCQINGLKHFMRDDPVAEYPCGPFMYKQEKTPPDPEGVQHFVLMLKKANEYLPLLELTYKDNVLHGPARFYFPLRKYPKEPEECAFSNGNQVGECNMFGGL